MAISDVLGPIRRRWYILLVGLVLAGCAGWAAGVFAPSQYTARGLVMLLPSPLTTGPKGNPLLNLGGLELPARVLIAYYSSEPAQSDLEKVAPKATVQVALEASTQGPIIAVDVKDATPDGAMSVLHYVTDSIPENLARIQQEVGTSKQAAVGSMPLVLDTEARRDSSLMVRLVVAAVLAVLALTFFLVFAVDGILVRRASVDADGDEGPMASDTPDGGVRPTNDVVEVDVAVSDDGPAGREESESRQEVSPTRPPRRLQRRKSAGAARTEAAEGDRVGRSTGSVESPPPEVADDMSARDSVPTMSDEDDTARSAV